MAADAQAKGNVLVVTGTLDHESVLVIDALGKSWLQNTDATECTLDLAQLTYTSSAGLALILGWIRVALQLHKQLTVCNMPSSMSALAKLNGLENIFAGK